MKTPLALTFILAVACATAVQASAPREAAAGTQPASPSADQIVKRVVESDPWGLGGAEVNAKATSTEKNGSTRALVFDAKSRRHAPPLGKSVISFSAPADVAGTKYLQIQNDGTDDERFLYRPEDKRSRRVAGTDRTQSFMGTAFSYADMDGRDLRHSTSVLLSDERVGKFDCWHVAVTPRNPDAVYSRIELWVRKDNSVPLKQVMFTGKGKAVKTLLAREIQRHAGRWFITGSKMRDEVSGRQTELNLDKIERREGIGDENFSVRAMEKG